jgi:hypothetical protein
MPLISLPWHHGTRRGRALGGLLAAIVLVLAAHLALALDHAQAAAKPPEKPRVLVTQDGEVDDMDSFIRYLYYANEFDTAGIILTSSTFHYAGNGSTVAPFRWTGTEWVNRYLDHYEQIRPNLTEHADGYPTADHLRSLYKIGNITNVGEMEQVTEGSEWIKKVLLDNDDRTLYIQAWGGNNTTARALKSIQEQYQGTPQWPAIVEKINRKVVLYNILTQDQTLDGYIRPNWPGIKIIDNQRQFWSFAYLWPFVTPLPNQTVLRAPWMEENLLNGTGPLMAEYRTYRDGKPTPGDDENRRWMVEQTPQNQNQGYGVHDFISEGDSPAYMHLFDFTGLRSSENPTWGGWGGRFTPNATGWIDTEDDTPYTEPGGLGTYLTPRRAYPLTRWFPAIQHDFASRVQWGVASTYRAANHPPKVSVPREDIVAAPGHRIQLTGKAVDPDHDDVVIRWWQYHEADTYPGRIEIEDRDTRNASIRVPATAAPGDTIHVIMEATDGGTPQITRYQRVVVTVCGTPSTGATGGNCGQKLGH